MSLGVVGVCRQGPTCGIPLWERRWVWVESRTLCQVCGRVPGPSVYLPASWHKLSYRGGVARPGTKGPPRLVPPWGIEEADSHRHTNKERDQRMSREMWCMHNLPISGYLLQEAGFCALRQRKDSFQLLFEPFYLCIGLRMPAWR